MNKLEYEMVDVLKCLKQDYGVFEIKAEFEAEGSRMEELMRLKDITTFAGLPIILKIGGVEAVTDVYNALSIGVKGIIAPMVETPFALSKYLNMIKTMIAEDNAKDIYFAFNVETITAFNNLDKMLDLPDIFYLSSVTFGRVDFVNSFGLGREQINSPVMLKYCEGTFKKFKALGYVYLENGFKTALGGGISKEALSFIEALNSVLDKFETRKVVFPVEAYRDGEKAILKAVEFELLWLKSKRRYYSRIKVEDEKRIEMLEGRLKA